MVTVRNLAFLAAGLVTGPFVAVSVLIGIIAWNKPMASGWLQFPGENWHHIAIRLSPWPILLIDGGPFYPEVTEVYVRLNSTI